MGVLCTCFNHVCVSASVSLLFSSHVCPFVFSSITQNGDTFRELYSDHLLNSPLSIPRDRFEGYSVNCYGSTWILANALNETLSGTVHFNSLGPIAVISVIVFH